VLDGPNHGHLLETFADGVERQVAVFLWNFGDGVCEQIAHAAFCNRTTKSPVVNPPAGNRFDRLFKP